jgi:maltooligosyltrehalose trehalohydrolase
MDSRLSFEGRITLGAEPCAEGVWFEVWAPRASMLDVRIDRDPSRTHALQPTQSGYFAGMVDGIGHGSLYEFIMDGGQAFPDPRSRFQPEGPHGPSMVVDSCAYDWHDSGWPGISLQGQIIHECHIGTFTPAGTFDAAAAELGYLKSVGYTAVEIMPIAEFPGRFNWGYDGVDLYAPYHGYGDPEALKRFVDAAHGMGLGVILDVVYNHLGADGNYLEKYSEDYFTDRYANEWGKAINFDGAHSVPVRDFFIRNACYWLQEFHIDGLRLDATQSMHDSSKVHVLQELTQSARRSTQRRVVLIAENEPQCAEHLLPIGQGGFGLDGMWNDDFHHSARVALTGRYDGYLNDHRGRAQEFVSAVRHGFLFQGQYYRWQRKSRGSPVTLQPASSFVIFLQNHDQVANTLYGVRLPGLTSPSRLRAMTALLLLAPQTPLLFMGQEFGCTSPFPFFADHVASLAPAVHAGRRQFVAQFKAFAGRQAQASVLDPADWNTFQRAKLDPAERDRNAPVLALHRDLMALRKSDALVAAQDRRMVDGAVLSESAWLIRWDDSVLGSRLLIVNLGADICDQPTPEPLLAPPAGCTWSMFWCSEDIRYGGLGARSPMREDGWDLAGESACFLRADRRQPGA